MKKNAPDDLRIAVARAAGQRDLLDELAALYVRLDRQIEGPNEPCDRCGRCCDFAAFGHRLYVTPIELALLAQDPPPPCPSHGAQQCPYQINGQCAAHGQRALGCRVFFCRSPADRQQALYEPYHAELGALHERSGVPYLYAELTQALARIGCR